MIADFEQYKIGYSTIKVFAAACPRSSRNKEFFSCESDGIPITFDFKIEYSNFIEIQFFENGKDHTADMISKFRNMSCRLFLKIHRLHAH